MMKSDKKNLLSAALSGLVAGTIAAMVVCSLFVCPSYTPKQAPMHCPSNVHHRAWKGKNFDKFNFDPTPEMKEHFAKKLGLTDEQKAAIEKMRAEDMAKIDPLVKQIDEIKNEIKSLRKEGRERFESILTDEQKEILKDMHKKHKGFKKHHKDGKKFGKKHHGKRRFADKILDKKADADAPADKGESSVEE